MDAMKNSQYIKNDINTEADSGLKGFGLQKLRAAERLLLALQQNKKGIFCTIEYVDDVFEVGIGKDGTFIKAEQNKNYSTNFSINSEEVKNSLRIFIDTWRKIEEDENIVFVFYTNVGIKKERRAGELAKFEELPEEPLLQLLKEKNYDKALPFIIPVIKQYYIAQHSKHEKEGTGEDYYKYYIDSLTPERWVEFFELIEWKFNEKDEWGVRKSIDNIVSDLCYKFNVDLKYKQYIIAQILDLVESQALENGFLNQMVHVAQVEVLFKDYVREAKVQERLDPMHQKWDEIEASDARDIEEKIYSVCPQFDKNSMEEIQDDFVNGKFEQENYGNKKAVKAYNYRIYNKCRREIKRFLLSREDKTLLEDEIQNFINQLVEESYELIIDKSKTYDIPYLDREMVYKSILILFQECYLALD